MLYPERSSIAKRIGSEKYGEHLGISFEYKLFDIRIILAKTGEVC